MASQFDEKPVDLIPKDKIFYSIFDPLGDANSPKSDLWANVTSKFNVASLGPLIHFSKLQKKSKALGYWVTRYYFLFDEYMAYGSSKNFSKIKKYISLKGLKVWLPNKDDTTEKDSQNSMLAFFRCNKMFMLKAQTKAMLNEWLGHLRSRTTMVNLSYFYNMLNMLGKGSYGKVYLIEQIEDNEKYAAKVISKEQIITRLLGLDTLFNEIKTLKKLDHKNIVKLKEVFETPTSVYLITEYVDGEELKTRLHNKIYYSEQECIPLMRNILETVAYLHEKNIVHRDLKLENILIASDTDSDIKIIDFGLSVDLTEAQVVKKGGTPGYMAPEVLNNENGRIIPTTKEDMFSLGCVFYRLLTGKKLFNAGTAKEMFEKNKECYINLNGPSTITKSTNAKDLLTKLLEKDPNKRLSAVEALDHPFFKPEQPCTFIELPDSSEDTNIPSISQYQFDVNSIKESNILSASRFIDFNNGSVCMVPHIPHDNMKQIPGLSTPVNGLHADATHHTVLSGGAYTNYAGESSIGSFMSPSRINFDFSSAMSPQNILDAKMKGHSPSNSSFRNTLAKQVFSQGASPIKLSTPSMNPKAGGFSDYFNLYQGNAVRRKSTIEEFSPMMRRLGPIGEAKDGDSSNSNAASQQNVA